MKFIFFNESISKVFRLLDEILKVLVLRLLDKRILKVPAPFERTSKVLAPFERTLKISDFYLKELRRSGKPTKIKNKKRLVNHSFKKN
ncbi:unnamed protein product [Rhizophagus irregularis]|nr:unnamed protein product [Rhizophagus irregularis]CAB5365260.1 unnamed protein product [Rhizophagus irregularis]